MATVLITCCPYDPSTRYGYYYLKKLAKILARHNHKVVILRSAILSKFHRVLVDYDPDLVILNGHGGSKGVTGCNDHVILGVKTYDKELGIKITRQNPEWMSGRIVYLFTCHTGKELAYRLIDYGAIAVAAFREAFIFLAEDGTDKRAYPFFDSALRLPLLLAEGATFSEACAAVRSTLADYREEAEKKGDELEAKYCHHDLVNFIAIGNMDATLI